MNHRAIRERLARVEATILDDADAADDLAERQALLACIVDDERAGQLYHSYLESLSVGSCPHETFGACQTCWRQNQQSEKVQTALSAFRAHIHALLSQPQTEGESQ